MLGLSVRFHLLRACVDLTPLHCPSQMPATESLKDTCVRVLPMIRYGLAPRILSGQTVLLSAHANTIRSILYHLDDAVTKDAMKGVKVRGSVASCLMLFLLCHDKANPPHPHADTIRSTANSLVCRWRAGGGRGFE